MRRAVVRKISDTVEGVREYSSLVQNHRVPKAIRHPRRARGAAVAAGAPGPPHRVTGLNRDR